MAESLDPNVERKGHLLESHRSRSPIIRNGIPTFSLVEFNTSELCNRSCVFCPRSDPKVYPNRNLFMSLSLYKKIMTDLSEIDYAGTILFSAFSEPLLHKGLEEMISLSKGYCPGSRVECVTNGDFLTASRLRSLFAAGLDALLISLYDGPHQHELFERLRLEAGLSDAQVIRRVRYLPPEEHFGLTMSNRAGMVNLKQLDVGVLAEPLQAQCYYPHYQVMVDWDGTILLCPHDWGKRINAGTLADESILDIWAGEVLAAARHRLARADRGFVPCSVCDVRGTLMGKEHAEAWAAFYDSARGQGEGVSEDDL